MEYVKQMETMLKTGEEELPSEAEVERKQEALEEEANQ